MSKTIKKLWIFGLLLLMGLAVGLSSTDMVAQTAAKVQETGKQLRGKVSRSATPNTPVKKATKKLSLKEIKALKAKQLEAKNAKRESRAIRKFKTVEGNNTVECPADRYEQLSEKERKAIKKEVEAAGYKFKVVENKKAPQKKVTKQAFQLLTRKESSRKSALDKSVVAKKAEKIKATKPKKSLYEKAQELNKKYTKLGFKAVLTKVGGKEFIQLKELPQQYGMAPQKAQK